VNYHWNWGVFLQPTSSGGATYLGWLLEGLRWTVGLSLASWVVALLLGTVFGVLRTVPSRWARGLATAWVEAFRNVPLLVQLFVWYFVAAEFLPRGLGDAIKQSDPLMQQFVTACLGLGMFTSARVAEQVRSGIESLPTGQKNAALALGLSLPQAYRHVMLPMAFRIILPPLTSEFLNIFKNSAAASTIGLIELSRQAMQLQDYTAQPYESFIAVTGMYLLVNFGSMLLMRRVETRARVPGYIGTK
jgi:glutamate/aspartate transport system permease protein